ncbi:hypothetical protein J437_LFUL011088 [Ladona fulva]|uniref:ATP-dependent DNA helicase n=1 Tax=Ladona fulva TaxID=123851 RepID=A0A8K0K7L0_LADFU|nr:hypothetical protein J437_LFUL011088 [Ladona fulva]
MENANRWELALQEASLTNEEIFNHAISLDAPTRSVPYGKSKNTLRGILYLDAPGGTEKTFLISLILAEICSKKEIALA